MNKQELLAGTVDAMCYSGFRNGQHPDRGDGAVNPSREEILEDLLLMQEQLGTRLIRVYDCGENTQEVLQIIQEQKLNIQVLLGVWLKAELSNHETCAWLNEPIPEVALRKNKVINKQELAKGIELANTYPDIVAAVCVGNEALVDWNDHKVDTKTVIDYVQQVQEAIQQPVTVADNYLWWAEQGQQLADVVDFVSIHVYPIWEGKSIEEAMEYTRQNVRLVQDALPNKPIVITEAGWATVASEFEYHASESNQLRYLRELMEWSAQQNITTFFFEVFDEDWKGDPYNPEGAEKHWGLFNVDRTPKLAVRELTKTVEAD